MKERDFCLVSTESPEAVFDAHKNVWKYLCMLCVYHLYVYVTFLVLVTHINVGKKKQENVASLRLSLTNFRLVKCMRFHIHVAMQCCCMQTWSCF